MLVLSFCIALAISACVDLAAGVNLLSDVTRALTLAYSSESESDHVCHGKWLSDAQKVSETLDLGQDPCNVSVSWNRFECEVFFSFSCVCLRHTNEGW